MVKTCSVVECNSKVRCRFLCHRHYRQARSGKIPMPGHMISWGVSDEEKFWRKVNPARAEECWEWAAATSDTGYGTFHAGHRRVLAHRWAYEHLIAPIPEGLQIDHLCRNRPCVNPWHMEPVSRSENTRRGLVGWALRDTCRSGRHDINDPNNVHIKPNGERTCRACMQERRR